MHYCGRKCQKAHWGQGHKKECGKLQAQRERVKQKDKHHLEGLDITAKPQQTKVSTGKKKGNKKKKR